MGANMGKYEVLSGCYVPVGRGFRYKNPGQVVTLSDDDAVLLAEHVKPVAGESTQEPAQPVEDKPKRKRVAKRNTQPEVVEPEVVEPEVVEPEVVEPVVELVTEGGEALAEVAVEGVTSDDGDPRADHE